MQQTHPNTTIEENDLKDYSKNVVIPLMTIDDLADALIIKCFAGKSELTKASKVLGIKIGKCVFDINIKKIKGGVLYED